MDDPAKNEYPNEHFAWSLILLLDNYSWAVLYPYEFNFCIHGHAIQSNLDINSELNAMINKDSHYFSIMIHGLYLHFQGGLFCSGLYVIEGNSFERSLIHINEYYLEKYNFILLTVNLGWKN